MALKKTSITLALASTLFLASCSTADNQAEPSTQPGSLNGSPSSSAPSETTTPAPIIPALSLNVAKANVAIDQNLEVTIENYDDTIKSVRVSGQRQGEKGQAEKTSVKLPGEINASTWKATSYMEPSTLYTVKVKLEDGSSLTKAFKTKKLALSQQTYATVFPNGTSNVGVGQPIVVRFDLPVTEKEAVTKKMKVTTTPAQKGAWHWYSDTEVRWRPKTYWKPGTKVSVAAAINSVPVGNGRYGQFDVDSNFNITKEARVLKVNLDTHLLKAYKNGKLIKTIPISAGKEPAYTTRSGIKVIMSKNRFYDMNSSSIGIDPNSSEGYDLSDVEYAMRITNSGEFLHAAPWNTYNFGRYNASHGCTGASTANMAWVYNFVNIGDPVEYTGTSRMMTPENGWGDWNLSWKNYKN